MSWPKIVYPSGGGTTLTFIYPPRNIPAYSSKAIRDDDYSSYGDHQAVWERTDHFLDFDMPAIKSGTDTTAWQSFLDWAAQGGYFDYYPDASQGTYTTYHLVSTDAKIAYHAAGINELRGLQFRAEIS
jgi:hypothetical protein